jgi:Bacterial antitoxin of type II TA system, VapB
MARRKVTLVVDQDKLKEAQRLSDSPSMSATIDLALDRLIREEETRHDVELYLKYPQTEEELAFAGLPVTLDLGDEDVDYDAMYPEPQGHSRDVDDDRGDDRGDDR